MRRNWAALAVAVLALFVFILVALGAHVYRWEMLVWLAVAAGMALLVFACSGQERTKEGE